MKAGYQVIHAYTANYTRRHPACQKHIQYPVYVNPYRRCPSRSRRLKMDSENSERSGSSSPESYTVPIVGYEIVEKRERFTVYKIHVQKQSQSWFIFRRYSDFERLNEKLMTSFPRIKLHLPPKRFFGDNFNPDFIARRAQGLQNFITALLQHHNLRICRETREFFCLDEPPGPFDSLEESRAYVQFLEEQIENTKSIMTELTSQLEATKSQLNEARSQIRSLEWRLRQRPSPDPPEHSTPTCHNSESRHTMDVQLSDISDTCSAPKARKSVCFVQTKSASEGNLLQLKRRGQLHFPTLKDQSGFRHSITFGEDSFMYNGFLDVEFHSNVTTKMKERKCKARKSKEAGKNHKHQSTIGHSTLTRTDENQNKGKDKLLRTRRSRPERKKEKRDSGIIGDSCTDSDF